MKIVYKLYEIRAQKGMSLRELEELSGIGKSTINRIENNLLWSISYANSW